MFWISWHKRSNILKTHNRRAVSSRFRPGVELLESRRLLSLLVGPNVNMSRLRSSQAEASIAMNPTNPTNLVAFSNTDESSTGVRLYVSNDAGATWTTRLIGHNDGLEVAACCDTQIAFDDFGNLFAVNIDFTGGSSDAIKVLRSSDGGATFVLQATIQRSSSGSLDQPSIATGHGMVWVSYNNGTQIVASGAAVTGLGQIGAFSTLEAAPGSNGGSFGNVAIGPNGQVMVTYQNPTGGTGPSTIFDNVDPDGLGPAGFGNAVTVTSTNVGGFDHIPPQHRRSVDAEATALYDRSGGPHNGRVYMIYTDSPTVGSAETHNYERFSDDNGVTWSSRVRIDDATTTNSHFLPQPAVDQTNGNLAVAWYDSRNAGSADQTAQIFATVSTDGGLTFEPNVQVSVGTSNSQLANSSTDYGDYMTMEFRNNVFYPVWSDNSTALGGNPDLPNLDIATARVTVQPPADHFTVVASPSTVTAGNSFSLTVTAQDASGNTLPGYRGTVHFTSSDSQAMLPSNYTFIAADNGVHTFTGVMLKTAGSQSITSSDTVNTSMTGGVAVTVNPAAATHFVVTAPATSPSGSAFTITVQAMDRFSNQATGYTGTVHFTSSDGSATLPANFTFTSTDQGVHTFTNGVTLRTTGNQSVTATDTVTSSITGSATVNVTAAAVVTHFSISAPANASIGVPFIITVTALDASNHTVTTYRGTVKFTSSDHMASLPADYTFTSADRGVHTFKGVILRTSGSQTITATDRSNPSITGTATVNARQRTKEPVPAPAPGNKEVSVADSSQGIRFPQWEQRLARELIFATEAHEQSTVEDALLAAMAMDSSRHNLTDDGDLFTVL
jgi:hypothetical protein